MIIKGYNIENLTFTANESINNRLYYKVLGNVDTNNKQVVVSGNGSKLTIIAKNSISLKPGFKVEKLARFKASIDKTIAN